MSNGYQLTPDELAAQVTALAELGDRAQGLVTSAGQLAQRVPKLGTAPPALHLAHRLQNAAGADGLTGEVTATSAELTRCHRELAATAIRYTQQETTVVDSLDRS